MRKNFILSIAALCTFAASQLTAATIYVSPKGIDNSATGTKENPFGTLAAALKAAQAAEGGSEIIMGEGAYFFPENGVLLKNYPSKEKPLTIRGENEKVYLIGGIRVDASQLKLVNDRKLLSKLPAEREGKLYGIDLKKFGVKDLGKVSSIPPHNGVMMSEAYYSEGELTLARYPNGKGVIKIDEVIDGGYQTSEDDPKKFDKNRPKTGGIMRYTDMRHERWVNAPDLQLAGVFNPGWLYGSVDVAKIDTKEKTIQLKTLLPWGITTAKKKLDVNSYHAYNLFEEIDADGEYYFDRQNLYFFVMLKHAPKDGAYIDFSILGKPIIQLYKSEHLKIKNLNFTASRTKVIQGDECALVTIEDCQFYNLGNNAISLGSARVDNYTPEELARTNNVVQNCKIFNTGAGGVSLSGGNFEKLLPSHNRIFNCEFYNNARWNKSYCSQAAIHGVGGFISHCYFHDQPHLSVSWGGSEQTIEFNYFERCCQDFHDMGIIYSGRAPHCAGNVIRGNFFAESEETKTRSMMCGVYVDDGSGGVLVEKNIFCRVGTRVGPFAAIYIHAGKDNISKDNVFIDCQASACQLPWSDERWTNYWTEKNTGGVKFANTEIFLKKYPKLKNIQDGSLPRINEMTNCLYFRTPLPHGGIWKLRGGHTEMKPTQEVGEVKYWNADLVSKYFGNQWTVRHILGAKPGLNPGAKVR